ncbi:MAG: hypothetical protein IJZ73_00650 [Clostridia bacterium]|nr:hypothetical protein [Clostridia bacterium]
MINERKELSKFFLAGAILFLVSLVVETTWFALLGNWNSAFLTLMPMIFGLGAIVCLFILKKHFAVSICLILKGLAFLGIYVLPSLITMFTVKEKGDEFVSAIMVVSISFITAITLISFGVNFLLNIKKKPLSDKSKKVLNVIQIAINGLYITGCFAYIIYYAVLIASGGLGVYFSATKLVAVDVLYVLRLLASSVGILCLHLWVKGAKKQ